MIAIDLGSNTIRFIEYNGSYWGKSFEKIVRTAESLHETGKIGHPAVERVLSAIEEAKAHLDFSSQPIVAVTTAAIRMATNGAQVINDIESESGVRFSIINGDEEARLTLSAVHYRLHQLQLQCDHFILADIGGGSTEIIVYVQGKSDSISIPMGIVTMSERSSNDAMLRSHLHEFESSVKTFLAGLEYPLPSMLVLTAGTPTTIAAFRQGMNYSNYDPSRINGVKLTLQDCIQTYNELMAMEESERSFYVGVGRELLIATGILMVESLFNSIACKEAVIVDDGLREGVALGYFNDF